MVMNVSEIILVPLFTLPVSITRQPSLCYFSQKSVVEYLYICLYVHLHYCTYVCVHACLHVCLHVCLYVRVYVCVYVGQYLDKLSTTSSTSVTQTDLV